MKHIDALYFVLNIVVARQESNQAHQQYDI